MGRSLDEIKTNFTSGELDPKLAARSDTKLYFNGCEKLRQSIVQPQGGAKRRPGLKYLHTLPNQMTTLTLDAGNPTYPEGNSTAWPVGTLRIDYSAWASFLITTSNIGSAAPYVIVHSKIVPALTGRCWIDVWNLWNTGTAGTNYSRWKVQWSPDDVVWNDFDSPNTITCGTAARAQWRRLSDDVTAALYFRLVLDNVLTAGAQTAQVSGFIIWSEDVNTPANYRCVPFEFDEDEAYMLVVGDYHASIFKNGAFLGDAFFPYSGTSVTPRVATMNWTQSADTLIAVQEDSPPVTLTRSVNYLGATTEDNWKWTQITFDSVPYFDYVPAITSPAVTLTPSAVSGTVTLTAGGATFSAGDVHQVIEGNGGLARIVRYDSTTVVKAVMLIPFFDTSAIASGSWTINRGFEAAWSATRGYPRCATFHEGRLFLGGLKSRPHTLYGSRVDDFFNFEQGQGLDDEALEATLDTDQVNAIVNIYSGRDLQLFTTGAEFFIPQPQGEPITPSNINAKRQTARGSSSGLRVAEIDGGTMFVQREGLAVREFLFSDLEQSYTSQNVALLSSHLFTGPRDFAIRQASGSDDTDLLYVVNDDGTLAICSTLRDQEVTAWTLNYVEDLSGDDVLFRQVGTLHFGEANSYFVLTLDTADRAVVCCFDSDHVLDLSKQSTGVGLTTVTGLGHLAGLTVSIVHSSAGVYKRVSSTAVVTAGAVTFSALTGTVEVGIPYSFKGVSMPIELGLPEGTARNRKKRVVEVDAILDTAYSLRFGTGTNEDSTDGELADVFTAVNGVAQSAVNGLATFGPLMGYTDDGQIFFNQPHPFPCTLLGFGYRVSI